METEKAEKDFSPKVAGVFIVLAIIIRNLHIDVIGFFGLPLNPNGLFELITGLIKMVIILAVYHFAMSFVIKKIFQTEFRFKIWGKKDNILWVNRFRGQNSANILYKNIIKFYIINSKIILLIFNPLYSFTIFPDSFFPFIF